MHNGPGCKKQHTMKPVQLLWRILAASALAEAFDTSQAESAAGSGAAASPTGLRLLAIGDWGGENDANPTTQAQIEASAGMSKLADSLKASGVLLLG